jgi:hypothetical protein
LSTTLISTAADKTVAMWATRQLNYRLTQHFSTSEGHYGTEVTNSLKFTLAHTNAAGNRIVSNYLEQRLKTIPQNNTLSVFKGIPLAGK